MGPRARYVGNDIPEEILLWQDPITTPNHALISQAEAKQFKKRILKADINSTELIKTAWASAASYRATDMRGGANGARIRLAPQNQWAVNNPKQLEKTLAAIDATRERFNRSLKNNKQLSMADAIVLAGAAAVEQAAKKAGYTMSVPFVPGRGDATQAQTNIESFAVLEPKADAFRNYFHQDSFYAPAEAMVDRANLLNLSVPEMTVLIGGLRVLDANAFGSQHGVLTERPGALTNDFFVNLLDMSTRWKKSEREAGVYQGVDRATGKAKWTATTVDLLFGSNSELRAVAEVYAADDGKEKLIQDFIKAWTKVMQADRFDLKR